MFKLLAIVLGLLPTVAFAGPITSVPGTATSGVSASSASATYVFKAGDTMTGLLNGTSIYLTNAMGIGTTDPLAKLDVNGNAQFGSGATKSTFSATGDLNLASNGDLTLTGPTAFITSGSSINASAFFGNGAGLTGVTGFVATSTGTALPSTQATTVTSGVRCLISTVTMTTTGGKIMITFTGSGANDTATSTSNLGLLMDGDFVTGINGSKNGATDAMTTNGHELAAYNRNYNFTFLQAAPSAAAHSWCVTAWTDVGTFTIGAVTPKPRLQIVELK